MKCVNCGYNNLDEDNKCVNCGERLLKEDLDKILESKNSFDVDQTNDEIEKADKNNKIGTIILAGILVLIMFVVYGVGYLTPLNDYKDVNTENRLEESLERYHLNINDIYVDDIAFDLDYKLMSEKLLPEIKDYKGTITTPEIMKSLDEKITRSNEIGEKLYWYAKYQVDLDASDENAQELLEKGLSILGQFEESIAFLMPELVNKNKSELEYILNYKGSSEIETKEIMNQLKEMKEHTLSDEGENLLAMASGLLESPKNIWDKITVLDPVYPVYMDEEDNVNDIRSYELWEKAQSDPEFALEYNRLYAQVNGQNDNALAGTLMAEVQKNNFLAKARNYNSALEMSLSESEIQTQLYFDLIKITNENLKYLHKYQNIIMENEDQDVFISNERFKISRGEELIKEALKPLGNDYVKGFENAFEQRWIDLYPSEYKESGAYTSGVKKVHPYIVMNYINNYDSVSTLIHEFGHLMNYYYSSKKVKGTNWTPQDFIAEVPSTMNETLLIRQLKDNSKDSLERLKWLKYEIENINNTYFLQTMMAEFQQKIHDENLNGNIMTADELNKLYGSLYIKYFGESVKEYFVDEKSNEWSQISHFYQGFYVYKYATSLALAYDVSDKILEDKNNEYRDKYLEYLSFGSTRNPYDAMAFIDIDLNNTKWLDNFMEYYKGLVEEYQELLNDL